MTSEFKGAIGIDLGTTFSCVAVFLNNQVDVIPNEQGNRTTPSCVAFQNNEILVGDSARNLVARGVRNVVYDAKRMIGRRFHDKSIQQDMQHWPFALVEGEGERLLVEVEANGTTLRLAPEEISALVLGYLKQCAERHLGRTVRKAVITVPAYFNDAQRERTKAAAAVAGLEVLRIVNEPTAAAMCYGLGIGSPAGGDERSQNVVVFDFGGGTFDVSVITIEGGGFAVRATAGDTHLGGQDIDACLLRYVLADLKAKHGVSAGDNLKLIAKARAACERTKRVLSSATLEELEISGVLAGGEDYALQVSRAKLEELSALVFDRCMTTVAHALQDAGMTVAEVDEVILVGGSSRIPRIQQLLSDYFKGKRLCCSVHPDEAVATGAAIQASILSTDPTQQSARTAGVVLLDVVPLSIGVEVDNGKFDVVIPRNTTIPYKAVKEYSTVEDNQDAVDIAVFEGERPLTKHNHKLGEFSLEGITHAKQGDPTIRVTFSVDADGLLTIIASEDLANNSKQLTVQSTDRLSAAEVTAMMETANKLRSADALAVAKADCAHKLPELLRALEEAVERLPQPPSTKLAKRLHFIPHARRWLGQQLESSTEVKDITRKHNKIEELAAKAMERATKEARRGAATSAEGRSRSSQKRPRSTSSGEGDDGESGVDDNESHSS